MTIFYVPLILFLIYYKSHFDRLRSTLKCGADNVCLLEKNQAIYNSSASNAGLSFTLNVFSVMSPMLTWWFSPFSHWTLLDLSVITYLYSKDTSLGMLSIDKVQDLGSFSVITASRADQDPSSGILPTMQILCPSTISFSTLAVKVTVVFSSSNC